MEQSSILVTDSPYKHTLSIVRSLGKHGIKIYSGSEFRFNALSNFSKYSIKSVRYPDPQKEPFNFCMTINRFVDRYDLNFVIPVGYYACFALSKYRNEMVVKAPVPEYSSFLTAALKNKTIKYAENKGIPVPDTIVPQTVSEIRGRFCNYPVVVKGIKESGIIFYVNNEKELIEVVNLFKIKYGEFPLIQEYIPGSGYGFFGLYKNGDLQLFFMHRRIREFPTTGGSSTCAESFYDKKLLYYGNKLLSSLKWHGVAMVEFKKDVRDGQYKLMEINPKFWGSLDLAIASGVNFPFSLYKMLRDEEIEYKMGYNLGIRFSWPFPDDYYRVIENPRLFMSFLRDLINPRIKKNIDIFDLFPNLIQFRNTLVNIRNGM